MDYVGLAGLATSLLVAAAKVAETVADRRKTAAENETRRADASNAFTLSSAAGQGAENSRLLAEWKGLYAEQQAAISGLRQQVNEMRKELAAEIREKEALRDEVEKFRSENTDLRDKLHAAGVDGF
jgi:DNA repair exonuclease SbcCD ATPase subunit